jgi:hypothetical protein
MRRTGADVPSSAGCFNSQENCALIHNAGNAGRMGGPVGPGGQRAVAAQAMGSGLDPNPQLYE